MHFLYPNTQRVQRIQAPKKALSMIFLTLVFQLAATIHPLYAKSLVVTPGQSIQETIKRADPGDVILIEPGVYQESIYVDKADLTIRGVQKEGQIPRLDGGGALNDAVIASASGFTIEMLEIAHYKGNGVMTQGAHDVLIRNLIIRDTGIYGIYPTLGKKIRIENNVVSGIADAGIYIGMCDYVDVKHNEVYENVAGIEIENSRHALVAHNTVYNNTGGILVFALPGLPRKKSEQILVFGNQVIGNNHINFGAPGSTVSSIPPGSGIIVLASERVDIVKNIIRDHHTSGLFIVDHQAMPGLGPDPQVDPLPREIRVKGNLISQPLRSSFSRYFAWYHYVIRSILAGNIADGAIEQLLPKTVDVYGTGLGQRICIDGFKGLKINNAAAFTDCDHSPTAWLTELLAPLNTTKNPLSGTDLYEHAISFSDLGQALSPEQENGGARLLGETIYNNVCSGCHALNMQRVGPSLKEIAAKYQKNPDGIVHFATNPTKVRKGFPVMPAQAYLGQAKLEATAQYILQIAGDQTKTH